MAELPTGIATFLFTDIEGSTKLWEPSSGGASRDPQQSQALVQQACYWTGGHPSLTQRLCRAIAEDATVVAAPGVDRLCEFSYQGGSKRCVGLGPP